MTEHEHSEDCGCEHEAINALLFGGTPRPPAQLLASLDRTIEQFGSLNGLADRRLVARSLFTKARVLAEQRQHGDAVVAVADLERRAATDADVVVQRWLGSALVGIASSLVELWLPDQARETLRRAAARFGTAETASLRAFAPRALCDECVVARDARDVEGSIAAAHAAWELFGADPEADVRYWAASALHAGALTKATSERLTEASRDYETLYTTYRSDRDSRIRAIAVSAWFDDALILTKTGRIDDAQTRYAEIAEHHVDDDAAAETVAKSLLNFAVVLGKRGRREDEMRTYDRIDARYGSIATPEIARWVAAALRNKALTLEGLGRQGESQRLLLTLVKRYGAVKDAAVQSEVRAAERDLARVSS